MWSCDVSLIWNKRSQNIFHTHRKSKDLGVEFILSQLIDFLTWTLIWLNIKCPECSTTLWFQLYELKVTIEDGYLFSEKTFGQFELLHKQLQKHFIESTLPQWVMHMHPVDTAFQYSVNLSEPPVILCCSVWAGFPAGIRCPLPRPGKWICSTST